MLRAAFIGIDCYADPRVRDLTGARRDATALWALFADNLPSDAIRLVTDSQATAGAVRAALDDTLGSAAPEDTVILSFSGHGTHDHRLVAHDTTPDT
jgi:hypothetical protein